VITDKIVVMQLQAKEDQQPAETGKGKISFLPWVLQRSLALQTP
jgi:hypothetical protein